MVERYAREEMSKNWTQHARYAAWLEVEKAAVKAWAKLGKIPKDDADKIVKNATFSVERIEEIEAVTKHDLIAFNTSVSESLGKESRWFHYGMTSSDAVDTGVALQMRDSLKIVYQNNRVSFFNTNSCEDVRNPLNVCEYGNLEETFIFTEQDYENAEDCNGNCE